MAPSLLLFASAKIGVFYQPRKFLNIFLAKNARVSDFCCIFAPANRDLAQLVAHYVRDVGVAGSSPVIPTASGGKATTFHRFFSFRLSVRAVFTQRATTVSTIFPGLRHDVSWLLRQRSLTVWL